MPVEIFEDPVWQMSLGERAAVEGVLAQLHPSLAIELGSMEGACVRRIAAYSEEAHSFDLDPPSLAMPENVTLHTGDSHQLLPPFLAELAAADRNLDFAMVDGDHTPEGVRQNIEDLLNCTAVAQTVILIHDTANERVRRGLDAVRFTAWPKVAHVELDWVPGRMFAEEALRNDLWFGLGLVIVDSARLAYSGGPIYEQRYREAGPMLAEARKWIVARERVPPSIASPEAELGTLRERVAELGLELGAARYREAALKVEFEALQHRAAGAVRALENIKGSVSWKLTGPFREAKRRAARRAKGQ